MKKIPKSKPPIAKLPKPKPKEKDLTIKQLGNKYRIMIQNKLDGMKEKDRLPYLTKELKNLGIFKIEK
tara:strand:+ start:243 stop:446 length:204 start_codon:yes stop_codon:yes gene_type:complete